MSETKKSPKNSKKFPLVPVLVLAVIGGAVAFSLLRKKPMMDGAQPMPGKNMKVTEDKDGNRVAEVVEGQLDFANIWQQKQGAYKCEMVSDELSYTYYFNNEQMAIDMIADGQSGHVIWDGEFMYNWSDETKQGVKMPYNLEEMEEDMLGFDPDEYENEMADYELMAEEMGVEIEMEDEPEPEMPEIKCQKWRVDKSKFTVPSDVAFQDLSEMYMMGE